jgi:hypothetical protein
MMFSGRRASEALIDSRSPILDRSRELNLGEIRQRRSTFALQGVERNPDDQIQNRSRGLGVSGSPGTGFGTGIGMSGSEVAGWLNARGITERPHTG